MIASGAAYEANDNKSSTTELDSHANMVVVGANATVIQETGLYADVNAFADEVNQMKRVPIKDMAVAYDCPYQHKTFLLIFKNALHVPSMNHNLISPFIMEEAGLEVNSKPKIHSNEVTVGDHSFYDSATDLRVPFQLRGIFSYFKTRSLTADEIMNCTTYDTVYLSPDSRSWNPTDSAWAEQEAALLDSNGDVPFPTIKQPTHLISEQDAEICSLEAVEKAMNEVLISSCKGNPQDDNNEYEDWLIIEDPVRAHIAASEPALDYALLGADVKERMVRSKIMAAAGSTTIDSNGCELFEACEKFGTDISAFIGATSASKPTGITAETETLSKIW